MIKRLAIVCSVIVGVPVYFYLNHLLLAALFPAVMEWGGIEMGILIGVFGTPSALILVGYILYGIAELVSWIATGKSIEEIDFSPKVIEQIETDPDEKKAIQELNKEFPGA